MEQTWKTHIIILIAINFPELIRCSPLDDTADAMDYPVQYMYDSPDFNDQLQKRLSSFVRIGRGLSSFIRIGKNDPGYAGYELEPSEEDASEGEYQKRKSAFVRIGRGEDLDADKRLSSFVRIGKSSGDEEPEPYYAPLDKRGGAFIRLGKFPSAAFVRNRSGKIHSIASPPYYRRSGRIGHSSFIRIGKRDTRDAMKLAAQNELDGLDEQQLKEYMRYKQAAGETETLTEPMTDLRDETEKRMSSFVRIGRQGDSSYIPNTVFGQPLYNQQWPTVEAKRFSKFVRIGKNFDAENMNKRLSSFVRIGKSFGTMDDLDKRMSKFVRIGKNSDDVLTNEDKRMSKFVRIGKASEVPNESFNADKRRLSSFVRIGKNIDMLNNNMEQDDSQDTKKRMSSFVRIGKSDGDKRMSSFVRIGKASATNILDAIQTDNTADLEKEA